MAMSIGKLSGSVGNQEQCVNEIGLMFLGIIDNKFPEYAGCFVGCGDDLIWWCAKPVQDDRQVRRTHSQQRAELGQVPPASRGCSGSPSRVVLSASSKCPFSSWRTARLHRSRARSRSDPPGFAEANRRRMSTASSARATASSADVPSRVSTALEFARALIRAAYFAWRLAALVSHLPTSSRGIRACAGPHR